MSYSADPIIISRETPGYLGFKDFSSHLEMESYFHRAIKAKGTPKVSIAIMSHRNVSTLRLCVDCVLRFAEGIDYELILLDNASEDGDETYDYMQSVPYNRKRIIKMCDNMGSYFNAMRAWGALYNTCDGDYIYHLNDDQIITENALQNLLAAIESDPSIGMVIPKSSNVWMGQDPGLTYSGPDDMFAAAKEFNVYDPRKWEERLYVSGVSFLFRRELRHCMLCANPFGPEMSQNFAIRTAGYRVMLLGDTWIHHDHDYSTKETYAFIGETAEKKKEQEIIDRLKSHLFYGLSFFEEICVFESELVSMLKEPANESPSLLSVDVKAGQGLLDLKNRLRTYGVYRSHSTAFCTEAKYYPVLYTIADEVVIDRIDYISELPSNRFYDSIIVGTPINLYKEPIKLVSVLANKLNPSGQLLFKLRNTASIASVIKMLGFSDTVDGDMPVVLSEVDVVNCLNYIGFDNIDIRTLPYQLNADVNRLIDKLVAENPEARKDYLKSTIGAKDFLFAVTCPPASS